MGCHLKASDIIYRDRNNHEVYRWFCYREGLFTRCQEQRKYEENVIVFITDT